MEIILDIRKPFNARKESACSIPRAQDKVKGCYLKKLFDSSFKN
jgi:hypothetical protein